MPPRPARALAFCALLVLAGGCASSGPYWDRGDQSAADDEDAEAEAEAQAEMDAADRAERIKSIRSLCKKQLEKLSALFQENSRELGEELALARPVVQALMEVVAATFGR